MDMLCYDTKGTLTQKITTIELQPPWCETFEQELLLFADLTTSEFVSRYTGYKPNNVWSGLKSTHTDVVGTFSFSFIWVVQCTTQAHMLCVIGSRSSVCVRDRTIHIPSMFAHERSSSFSRSHTTPLTLFSSSSTTSSTITSQVTLPINKPCAQDPQNEEYGSVAKTTSSAGKKPNVIDNLLRDLYSDLPEWVRVDVDTEPSYSFDAELYDELIRKALPSPLFTQEREESANLRQTYHSHEESLLPAQSFFAHSRTERPVYEPSSNLPQKRKSSRDLENEQIRILLERQKRANSCWNQIWDPEARTSSRFWQKRYPGINWNYWFSANGSWSCSYRMWAIQARSITTTRRNVRTKSGSSWNLYQEHARHGTIAEIHVLKVEELSRRKLTEDFEAVTSFFQGSNVKTVCNFGDNDAKYPDAEIDDVHTRNSLASPLYLQEREASASLLQTKRKLVSTCTVNF